MGTIRHQTRFSSSNNSIRWPAIDVLPPVALHVQHAAPGSKRPASLANLQSIFLARIVMHNDEEVLVARETMGKGADGVDNGVGYSYRALVGSIAWGSVMVLFCLLVAGICTYPKGLPIGGTNSAVISAACHVKYGGDGRRKVDEDISNEPLMWGVTIPGSRDVVGHCCFSSGEVERPEVGCLYAGVVAKTKVA
jgi:hypothetical protein